MRQSRSLQPLADASLLTTLPIVHYPDVVCPGTGEGQRDNLQHVNPGNHPAQSSSYPKQVSLCSDEYCVSGK